MENSAVIIEKHKLLNELAMKRQKLLLDGNYTNEKCIEIEEKMSELRQQIKDSYKAVIEEKIKENEPEEKTEEKTSLLSESNQNDEVRPEETEKSSKFYTIASKEIVREELPELLEEYAEHSFFALLLIEDGEEAQSVKLVTDTDGKMTYYPALDNAKSDKERQEIMDNYFKKLEQSYFYARYQDIFM